ncbi:MAG: MerR family transcriptional regulator [Myxococcota bacterium]
MTELSRATGVPAHTLKRWSEDYRLFGGVDVFKDRHIEIIDRVRHELELGKTEEDVCADLEGAQRSA